MLGPVEWIWVVVVIAVLVAALVLVLRVLGAAEPSPPGWSRLALPLGQHAHRPAVGSACPRPAGAADHPPLRRLAGAGTQPRLGPMPCGDLWMPVIRLPHAACAY
jgi:hypothetical protein